MKATKVTIGHICENAGTIDPYTEYFASEDQKDIERIAFLVSANQTGKRYWLMSNGMARAALAAVVGQPLPRDAFVWFE